MGEKEKIWCIHTCN